jgi:hypothetical protein
LYNGEALLETERQYFESNLPHLLTKYNGNIVVVKGNELVGTFDTVQEALEEGARRFGLDSFLVRRIEEHQQEISIPALTLGVLRANPPHTTRG